MKLTDRYCPESKRLLEENKDKQILSDDAFVIAVLLDKIGRALRGR